MSDVHPPAELSQLHAEVSTLLTMTVPPPQELAQVQALMVRAEQLQAEWEQVALHILLARQQARSLDQEGMQSALNTVQLALPRARHLGDHALTARLLSSSGMLFQELGRYAEALEAFTECLKVSHAVQDHYVRFLMLNNIGAFHIEYENPGEALTVLREAQVAAQASGQPLAHAVALLNLMSLHVQLGEAQTVLHLNEELPPPEDMPLHYRVIQGQYVVQALVKLARLEEALEQGQQFLQLALEYGNELLLAEAWAVLAEAQLASGQAEQARENALPAQQVFQQFSHAPNLLENSLRLSHIYEALEQSEAALRWVREHQQLQEARRVTLRAAKASVFAVQARLQALEAETEMERHKNLQLSQVIEQLHAVQNALEHQSTHDALTGLLNRTAFHDQVQATLNELRSGGCAALIFNDLDEFKAINDLYGHAAGDDLLVQVAARLRTLQPDLLAGRIGGDEFVLLAHVQDESEALMLAERWLQCLAEPFELLSGDRVEISGSAGIALAPQHGLDADSLQQKADQAMYASKHQARGRTKVYSDMIGEAREWRLRLESDLRRAVREGELRLHYQGRFDVQGRQLQGFEALVRWQRPGVGLESPEHFIPVAEQSHLMLIIGAWVMQEACRQAVAWNLAEKQLTMAVNVSVLQFQQPDFVQVVQQALELTGCAAPVLTIELTETVVLQDVGYARETIRALQDLGLQVTMDDFGTGYSSLSVLRSLPLNDLKIDRGFMEGITSQAQAGSKAQVMLATIVELAHQLGMQVTAEGVETEAQMAFLGSIGCDHVQGFLLARPAAPAQASRLLVNVT